MNIHLTAREGPGA